MTLTNDAVADLTARIASTARVGAVSRPLLDGRQDDTDGKPEIKKDAWIGDFCTIGKGSVIGAYSIIQEYSYVAAGVRIGEHVLVRHRTNIYSGVQIGDNCIIHGHIAERTVIGSNCRVFGQFIHQQLDPTKGWDDPGSEEPSATMRDGAFIGWNAIIVGPVTISESSYVCAGALITRDVPARHIAYGRNQIIPYQDWPGALSQSPFFTPSRQDVPADLAAASATPMTLSGTPPEA